MSSIYHPVVRHEPFPGWIKTFCTASMGSVALASVALSVFVIIARIAHGFG